MSKPNTKIKSVESSVSKPNGSNATKKRASYPSVRAKKNIVQEAEQQANKILSAINEANEIQAGRKKGKSFDEFLKEI